MSIDYYYLQRNEDISGVSGTGRVAYLVNIDGIASVVLWDGTNKVGVNSLCLYRNIKDAMKVHGHENSTVLVPLEDAPEKNQVISSILTFLSVGGVINSLLIHEY